MTSTMTAYPAPRAARRITGPAGITLADVQREFPHYHCWVAVSGRCHARPRNASPGDRAPVTGQDPRALRQQIIQHHARHQATIRDAAIAETLVLIFGPAPARPPTPPPITAPAPNHKLRTWRETHGLTRAQMAEALNNTPTRHDRILQCSPGLIARWESGSIPWPSRKYQAALHDLTGHYPASLGFTPPEGTPGTAGQR